MAEFLCCSLETTTTLLVGYTPIQSAKSKVWSLKDRYWLLKSTPPPVTAPHPCEACHLLFTREDTEPKRLALGGQLVGESWDSTQSRLVPKPVVVAVCDPDEQLIQVYKLPWDRQKHSWVPAMHTGGDMYFWSVYYISMLRVIFLLWKTHVHGSKGPMSILSCLLWQHFVFCIESILRGAVGNWKNSQM